ncbi:hypothetical protein [Pseudarthrobacter sp. H2]|uniref:hypothetical protein n=1 Tax=Pseudarthrobacter sp. H2 TaxID=3418415 RepID=UPI003CEC97F5
MGAAGNNIQAGSDAGQQVRFSPETQRSRQTPPTVPLVGVAEILGKVSLRVEIHEQHTQSALGEETTYTGHQAGLKDLAFAVDYRDNAA